MKKIFQLAFGLGFLALLFVLLIPYQAAACSTFKLQKGGCLIYGHNLNQGDMDVPGLIFINKRGVFKLGRTLSELITKEGLNPSSHCWISRYGSVTFNNFGKDLPDGGMNEVGLYIWEMSADFDEYPKREGAPKLNQMHWMQYILDNCMTVEEAVQCAKNIEIDGWGWHFFVGDGEGNTAAVDFVDDEVLIYTGEDMPVPGLFNTFYSREQEVLKYYKGFGGFYEPELSDPEVPRFVKTARMIEEYDPAEKAVDYGFKMLDALKVYDVPEWSVIFDVQGRDVYFKTRLNPEIKSFSMDDIDFSNEDPVMILNMDIKSGGDVLAQFHPYTNEKFRTFTKERMFSILPDDFFTRGGLTKEEYLERFSTHSDAAALSENQFFKGVWKCKPDAEDEDELTLTMESKGDAVCGEISTSDKAEETYTIDHIHLIGHDLIFTFWTNKSTFIEARAMIDGEQINITFHGDRRVYGNYVLKKMW